MIEQETIESLRAAMAARVGIAPADIVSRRRNGGDSLSFRRKLCASLLLRRGLTRQQIGIVMCWRSSWVDEALAEVATRMQHRAFREYIDSLSDVYEEMAAMCWKMRGIN